MVRPENIRIQSETATSGLPATISDVTFLGDCQLISARTGWGDELSIRTPLINGAHQPLRPNDAVRLAWDNAGSYLFL
ncbi:TOBE domain-containing protein [Roseovarius sp. Pro17]|uniref:TOBE domain-containing protein n=1 Tax=Roseovarius sp. Pro17 TaxID=3108175 RepID=UPI002D78346A|nr:TOBE domain-containing protein [Roseovarius sp. Pro17]